MKENNTCDKWALISGLALLVMMASVFFSGVCFCVSYVIFIAAMCIAIDNRS